MDLTASLRIFKSLVRRAVNPLSKPAIAYDEGRSKIIADLSTALGLRLYRYGHFEPEIDLVRKFLKPGDTFIDGGAHVGLFTLVAARKVASRGRVIAFEPAPETRGRLLANINVNGFDWVKVHPLALAEKEKELEFVSFSGNGSGFSSFAPKHTQGGLKQKISCVKLDDFISLDERNKIKLIKLDLEGAEVAALQGATQLIDQVHPSFLIEVEPEHLKRQGSSANQLIEILESRGYKMYRVSWDKKREPILKMIMEFSLNSKSPNIFFCPDPELIKSAGLSIDS